MLRMEEKDLVLERIFKRIAIVQHLGNLGHWGYDVQDQWFTGLNLWGSTSATCTAPDCPSLPGVRPSQMAAPYFSEMPQLPCSN